MNKNLESQLKLFQLKLFVWEGDNVLPNQLGEGFMVAFARSVEEARVSLLEEELKIREKIARGDYSCDKNLLRADVPQGFMGGYNVFVGGLDCHNPSDTQCDGFNNERLGKWHPHQFYHDLSLTPKVVKQPRGFVGWGSDY